MKWIFTLMIVGYSLMLRSQELETIGRQKPFELHGTATVGAGYYASKGLNNTRRPYSYLISLAPEISIYGVKIPFNFTFFEGSKSVTNPFAQFGVNPSYKWAKGYFGWTNMTWSSTTLNGKTFLGAGIEINPSLFRFGAFYGRLNPALPENLLGPSPQQPQFRRRGWGFKIGVGNASNYVDLIWLHGKDIGGSIPTPNDPNNALNYTPAENALVGIKSHQTFLKKKNLIWDLEGTVSGYTRNLNAPLVDIGNGAGTGFLKVALPVHSSTGFAWSVRTLLQYKTDKYALGLDYNRIQPEFFSMGVDYLLNDQEKVSLTQSFDAAKKKVNVAFSEFYQHDNLNKQKAVYTHRGGLSANVNANINQRFGVQFSYNNYMAFQSAGTRAVSDTTRIAQLQNTFVVVPRYTVISSKMVHNVFLTLSYLRLDDLNTFTSKYGNNNTGNMNLGYSMTIIKWSLGISPVITALYSRGSVIELLNVGPAVSLNKTWLKGKLYTATTVGYVAGRLNGTWNSAIVNNTIDVSYRFTKNHSLRFTNSLMVNNSSTLATREFKGMLTYVYVFDYSLDKNRKQEKSF
ncbi:MAG: hypothetical protein U0T84_08065 [Chitinophagales bacterium]